MEEAAARRRKGRQASREVKVDLTQVLDLKTGHLLLRRPRVERSLSSLRDREDSAFRLSRCLSVCGSAC
jgi:hypothetical protein